MFGVIVSGRLAQVNFENVESNKFLLTIPDADTINHVVVFMTGSCAFPPAMAGSVYFSWPNENGPAEWQYLGFISNEKPSAIFKITKLKSNGQGISNNSNPFGNSNGSLFSNTNSFSLNNPLTVAKNAQIGIAIEPLASIQQLQPSVSTNVETVAGYAQKMAEHLFNYVSSFAQSVPNSSQQLVPLASIQQWYQNYVRKLEINPNFWKE